MTRNPDYSAYVGTTAGRMLAAVDNAWTFIGLALVVLGLTVLGSAVFGVWSIPRALVGVGLIVGGIADVVWGRAWRQKRRRGRA